MCAFNHTTDTNCKPNFQIRYFSCEEFMLSKSNFFFTANRSFIRAGHEAGAIGKQFMGRRSLGFFGGFFPLKERRLYLTTSMNFKALGQERLKNSLARKNYFIPEKKIGYWLIGTSTLVFGIVVVGGLTRLTESGLSITEWRPVTGVLPPMNKMQWEEEFGKYKNSPEFKQINSDITLEEFKFIYFMEWGHRVIGRAIGLFLVVPAGYFWAKGKLNRRLKWSMVGLFGLLSLQGFIGWWMVRSGLDEEDLASRRSKPTVSQYRLTLHLGAAFLMYLGVLNVGLLVLKENKWMKMVKEAPGEIERLFAKLENPLLKKVRLLALSLTCLTFVTAMSGGMVAGLDAGLIYNTFPHMGDDIVPLRSELMSPVFARRDDNSDMWWRNLLENPTTVQLIHRTFATVTFFSILAGAIFLKRYRTIVPKASNKRFHGVLGFALLQVLLGITTLIYLVPIPLAAAHQAGSLALLTTCLAFSASLRRPRPETLKLINETMKKKLTK